MHATETKSYSSDAETSASVKAILDLPCPIPTFLEANFETICENISEGKFGTNKLLRLKNSNLFMIGKTINVPHEEMMVEAKCLAIMSGHNSFPIFFGYFGKTLLMQFVGEVRFKENMPCVTSATLKDYCLTKHKQVVTYDICRLIVNAINSLHTKKILHNDIHASNIVLKNNNEPVIVDLGKATSMLCPKVYGYISRSKQLKIMKKHPQLAPELVSNQGAQSVETDIYSIGVVFLNVGHSQNIPELVLLARRLSHKRISERPSLGDTLLALSECSNKSEAINKKIGKNTQN